MTNYPMDADGVVPVPCGLCDRPTRMTATKRCDRCWELEGRIHTAPELAVKILAAMADGRIAREVWINEMPDGHRASFWHETLDGAQEAARDTDKRPVRYVESLR